MANYRVMVRLLLLICVGFLLAAIVPAVRAENWGWLEQGKLLASDGVTDDWFGKGVMISGDYAIVGAFEGDGNEPNSGSAYIFKKSDTTGDPNWYQQCKITAKDGETGDEFGDNVSISGDYVIVGALWGDVNVRESGSAYIFKKSDIPRDPNWYEQCKLTASDGAFYDRFGNAVSISGDYAIIGARWDDDKGINSGSAYMFKKSNSSCDPNWYEQFKLTASDGAYDDQFGNAVSVSSDYAIIGAAGDDDKGSSSGSAYIFKRSDTPGDPNWYEQCKLTASEGSAGDAFGFAVSVNGNYAIVASAVDDVNGITLVGSAYIFKRSDTPGDPNWYEQCRLTASDGTNGDYFGCAISINGNYVIVGARGDNDDELDSGSAYIFKKSDTPEDPNWYEQCKLTASDEAGGDMFGYAVSVSSDYAIIGARYDDDNGTDSGSAYIFKLTCPPADLDGDCFVDFGDFAVFTQYWLEGIEP